MHTGIALILESVQYHGWALQGVPWSQAWRKPFSLFRVCPPIMAARSLLGKVQLLLYWLEASSDADGFRLLLMLLRSTIRRNKNNNLIL